MWQQGEMNAISGYGAVGIGERVKRRNLTVEFTGERVIPGEGDVDLFNEHRARYLFAQRFSSGRQVLDAACGTGYGSALLGENAKAVFGVDISWEAVEYARRHYRSANVLFSQSDCLALPFASGQFDLVVAFEIIEHMEEPEGFLGELRRVLDPSGILILSTPNRLYYTEERGVTNPFHHREFAYPEFEEILQPLFPYRAILFENHVPGLLVSGPDAKPNFSSRAADTAPEAPTVQDEMPVACASDQEKTAHFFIALCSRRPLEPVTPLLYLPSAGNVLREREVHIRRLTEYLAEANTETEKARAQMDEQRVRLEAELEERTRWARELDRQLAEKSADLLQLQADYDSKVQWALGLEQELEQARAALQKLQADYDDKVHWALNLQQDLEQARAALEKLQTDYDSKIRWALSLQEGLEKARGDWHQALCALQKLQGEFDERTAWALRLDTELKQRCGDLQLLYGSIWYRVGKNLRLSPVPSSDRPHTDNGE